MAKKAGKKTAIVKVAQPPTSSFDEMYPTIARWISHEEGWIALGADHYSRSLARALYGGGMAWEGSNAYGSLDEALRAMDGGIASWLEETWASRSSWMGRASVRMSGRRLRARIGDAAMKVSDSPGLPATIMFGFVGLLMATVAALMIWPFCRPLLWFLFLLIAVFFLFAFVVISLSFFLIFTTVRRALSPGSEGSLSKAPGRSAPPRGAGTAGQTSDLWDRWLDGA
jgi:hypothetical protein